MIFTCYILANYMLQIVNSQQHEKKHSIDWSHHVRPAVHAEPNRAAIDGTTHHHLENVHWWLWSGKPDVHLRVRIRDSAQVSQHNHVYHRLEQDIQSTASKECIDHECRAHL